MSADRSEVIARINRAIDSSWHENLTIADNLDMAQATAMNARLGPHDLAGRDAEYYLKARSMIAAEPSMFHSVLYSMGGIGLSHLYNLGKWVCIGAGQEEYLRTDKNVGVTPPGGTDWVALGAHHGRLDYGQRKGKPKNVTLTETLERRAG
jgi:hypothetical protein